MSNLIKNSSKLAFHIVSKYINADTIAVDATCGNGNDTLALLEAGCKRIYAFDIQSDAIKNTSNLLNKHSSSWKETVTLINECHSSIPYHISKANVVIFNLGYLPCGDKSITTLKTSTAEALESCLNILEIGGICCLIMYDGHENGKEEKLELLKLTQKLNSSKFHVGYIQMLNQKKNPPEILLITKNS